MAASEKPKVDLSKVSDFEIQCLIIERDISHFRTEKYDELLNQIGEAKGTEAATQKKPTAKAEISEEPLNSQSWEDGKNDNGPYGAARLPQNNNPTFQQCLNILRQNITEKAHTFSEKSWTYYYWIDNQGTAIFRRKKKLEDLSK